MTIVGPHTHAAQLYRKAQIDKAINPTRTRENLHISSIINRLIMIITRRKCYLKLGDAGCRRDITKEVIGILFALNKRNIPFQSPVQAILRKTLYYAVDMERKGKRYDILLTLGQIRAMRGIVNNAPIKEEAKIEVKPKAKAKHWFIEKYGNSNEFGGEK